MVQIKMTKKGRKFILDHDVWGWTVYEITNGKFEHGYSFENFKDALCDLRELAK